MNELNLDLDDKADWRDQWDAIYLFIRQWLRIEFSSCIAPDQLFDVERSSGLTLSASAQEWFRFASAARGLEPYFTFRDCLVVEKLPAHNAVSLLMQGEGDVYWAIEFEHLSQTNPPVTVYYLDYDDPEGNFVREGMWSPSITSFAVDYFLTYLDSPGGGFRVRKSSPNFSRDALMADFGAPVVFGHLELFYGHGVLAALSTLEGNWHAGELVVEVARPVPMESLPPSIRRVIPDAHVLAGVMSTYR